MPPRKGTLTPDAIRRLALSLPECTEDSHMGRPDFRVRNKIFATLPPDGTSFNVKMSPANLQVLVAHAPQTYRDVWAGRWAGVQLNGISQDEARELLADAWALVAPASMKRTPKDAASTTAQAPRRPKRRR